MTVKQYKCTFLSDVVLQASSNTEGNVEQSDFVPGSNFLGMVAANGGYASFGADAFEVFHTGSVRFGDAHILVDNEASYKIPLTFFNLKIGEGYYNRLHLNDDEEQALREEQKQLKQIRAGYVNTHGKFILPQYRYAQKSAYDRKLRTSKEGKMFGYFALEKGTEWIFSVCYEDEKYVDSVEKQLFSATRLGKSKSAEYGHIRIEPSEITQEIEVFFPEDGFTYLYAKSRIALIDENGMPTLTPSIKNLGLEGGEIVWNKTQIKTVNYTPYNYTRQTKEYTRVALAKGSVIVIKDLKGEVSSKGVGVFLNEGFGDILVNPKFLESKYPVMEKYMADSVSIGNVDYDNTLVSFLESKSRQENEKFDVAAEVESVMKMLQGPSRSQWGQIRIFASIAKDKENLIRMIKEFISKGVSKKQWSEKKLDVKLINAIEQSKHPLAFVKLLSMMMPKQKEGAKNGK